jgi:hypothetical protein
MIVKRWIAVAGAAAVVLSFGSVLTTGAAWNDAVSVDGGPLSSGTLHLRTGNAGSQVSSYAFDELAGGNLRPGGFNQAPLTIKNAGNVDLRYRLDQTTATGTTGLSESLGLTVDQVTSEANCPIGAAGSSGTIEQLYSGALVAASSPTLRPLSPTSTETLCVRVTLPASVSNQVQNTSTRITFTFYAEST